MRASPGAELLKVIGFKPNPRNPHNCDRIHPIVGPAGVEDHGGFPLPRNDKERHFIQAQAEIARGGNRFEREGKRENGKNEEK